LVGIRFLSGADIAVRSDDGSAASQAILVAGPAAA